MEGFAVHAAERATIAAIVAFIVGLTGVGLAMGYPRQAILFPVLASILTVAFAAMRLREGRRAANEEPGTDPGRAAEDEAPKGLDAKAVAIPFLWVFAVLPGLWLLGTLVGLTLYVLAFLISHGVGWRRAVAVALGTLVFIHLVFEIALRVRLPIGYLRDAVGW